MSDDYRIEWYLDDLDALLEQSQADILTQLALHGTALVQLAAPVDTGFLRSTVQTIAYGGGELSARRERLRSGTTLRTVTRTAHRVAVTSKTAAAILIAADYAIYVERRTPFIYPAMEHLVAEVGGVVNVVAAHYGLR